MDVSGNLDITGATSVAGHACNFGSIHGDRVSSCSSGSATAVYAIATGPANLLGTHPGLNNVFASAVPPGPASGILLGSPFGGGLVGVFVPLSYTSGDSLARLNAATFSNVDMVTDVGLTPGTSITWTLTGSGDTITFSVQSAGAATGDPHFLRWSKLHHDCFHGECKCDKTGIFWSRVYKNCVLLTYSRILRTSRRLESSRVPSRRCTPSHDYPS